jgi:hypothetical protein
MVLVLFFWVTSCLCVDIQLYGLPSVREICCGYLLWGGYCKNRKMLSALIIAAYTRRRKIVHLCIAELKAFHLTPPHHLLFFSQFPRDPIYKQGLKQMFEASGTFCSTFYTDTSHVG